jgi:hypothetical protein
MKFPGGLRSRVRSRIYVQIPPLHTPLRQQSGLPHIEPD